MEEPKKNANPDHEDQQLIERLMECILDNLHKHEEEDVEPFEVYAYRLRSHLYSKKEEYKSHFVNGYNKLFAELSNDEI